MANTSDTRQESLLLAINSARTSTSSRHFRQLLLIFTSRLVLALTALPRWYGIDLDATGAFISAPLPPEEQVYLKGIPGYDLPKGKCLRLKKTI